MGLLDNFMAFAASDEGSGLAQGLLSANGSQGIAAGLAGMQRAKQMQQERAMQALQMQQMQAHMSGMATEEKMRQMQLKKTEREMADDEAARSVLQSAYGSRGLPQSPLGMGGTQGVNAALPPELQIGAQRPLPSATPGVTAKTDNYSAYKSIGDQLAAKGLATQAEKYYTMAEKFRPKYNTTPQVVTDPKTGQLVNALVSEDGSTQILPYGVKPDIQLQSLNDRVVSIDKNSAPNGTSWAMGQSPDSKASNAVAWANNSNATQRLAFDKLQANQPQFHDGQWLTRPTMQNPQGTATQVPGFSKPLTEFQGKSTNYAARMQDAATTLAKFEGSVSPAAVAASGYKPDFPQWMPGGQIISAGVSAANKSFNPAISDEAQQYKQAQENWVTANLRQESGAAIGRDEMAKDIAKWFPQPGDPQVVIEQKKKARKVAERAMLAQAGPGASQVNGIVNGPIPKASLIYNPQTGRFTPAN